MKSFHACTHTLLCNLSWEQTCFAGLQYLKGVEGRPPCVFVSRGFLGLLRAQKLTLEARSVLQGEDTISGFTGSEMWKPYLNPALGLSVRFVALGVIPSWFKSSALWECWKAAFYWIFEDLGNLGGNRSTYKRSFLLPYTMPLRFSVPEVLISFEVLIFLI